MSYMPSFKGLWEAFKGLVIVIIVLAVVAFFFWMDHVRFNY